MPRISRESIDTPFIHVMVQGINKEFIFNNQNYIKKYLFLIAKYCKEFNISILSYCIMNNHAHLLIYTEEISHLGKFMHKLNLQYLNYFNHKENRLGVLFRNRYKAEPIYNKKYLINCIRYIHMNPVKAKMVNHCKNYPYSSYNDYLYSTGVSKNSILSKVLGSNYRDLIIDCNTQYIFTDIVPPNSHEISQFLDIEILEFLRAKNKKLFDIFANKTITIALITYLKEESLYNFEYKDILKKIDLPYKTFVRLRSNKD